MQSNYIKIYLLILLSVFCFSFVLVDEKLQFKNKSVSVFKDGSGFFIKNAHLGNQKDKRLYLDENLPKASLGTFWFFSKNQNLAGVSSFADTVVSFTEKQLKATNLKTLLKKNVGKRVEILYKRHLLNSYQERTQTGKVIWFEGELIGLSTAENKVKTINYSEILNLTFIDKPIFESLEKLKDVSYKPILQIDLFKKMQHDELEMMYLTKGITWLPGYYVELQKNNRAKITLRSTLINDAEDIEKSDVHFVVGVPNFQFANELSPLYGEKEVSKFIGHLAENYQPLSTMNINQFSNSLRSHQIPNGPKNSSSKIDNVATSIRSVDANQSQDMFFYTAKNVSLRKGGRGFYNLFEISCPVDHQYSCDLGSVGENGYIDLKKEIKVKHALEIKNASEFPFTTGTAMVVSTENDVLQPICQDKVLYTPKGGTLLLNLNEAIDIFVSQQAKMKKKVQRSIQYPKGRENAPWYDKITVKCEITLKNHKDVAAKMNLRQTVFGEIEDLPAFVKNEIKPKRDQQLNQENELHFNFTLKPGEQKVVDYIFTRYVRN